MLLNTNVVDTMGVEIYIRNLTLDKSASCERITAVVLEADAHRSVADDSALRVRAAGADARISTLLVDASLITWTFGVAGTFGSAIWWRANVFRIAGARRNAVDDLALSV